MNNINMKDIIALLADLEDDANRIKIKIWELELQDAALTDDDEDSLIQLMEQCAFIKNKVYTVVNEIVQKIHTS